MGIFDGLNFLKKTPETPEQKHEKKEFKCEPGEHVRVLRSSGVMDEIDAGWTIDVPQFGYDGNAKFILVTRLTGKTDAKGKLECERKTVKREDLEAWNTKLE